MAPLAKRPRLSGDDYDHNSYDNVAGTSLTRPTTTSASMSAPYLSTTHLNGASANPSATSPRFTSRPLNTGGGPSSGVEDNDGDMAPPKSTSTSGTRGRGRGRGASRTTTTTGRAARGGKARTSIPADSSHHYYTNGAEEAEEDAPTNPLVFQCRKCFRLLGDSFSFVATDAELGYLILSDVSEVITQDSTYETSLEPGKDIGSTFARLRCAGCRNTIGRNYRTTPRDLDDLRDCYSLEVGAIFTYQLGSNFTKQLEEKGAGEQAERGTAMVLSANAAGGRAGAAGTRELETKMERTRALTIELSDRLIKAEEDIKRYSEVVERLVKEKGEAAETSAAAPQPEVAPLSQSTPTAQVTDGMAAEEGLEQAPSAAIPAAAAEHPSTPPPAPSSPLKEESSQPANASRKHRQSTTTTYASTRSTRRRGTSPTATVLLDSSNHTEP